MLNVIFPSLPYQRLADPMWQAELDVARQRGHTACLFDAEQEKLHQLPNPQQPTLYRGWMLTAAEYQRLATLTPLLVSPERYLASHRADGWYAEIAGFTPQSSFVAAGAAAATVEALMRGRGRCFIKGLSKSFGPESVISSLADYDALLQKHEVPPRDVLFAREFVELSNQPERRYFAVRDEAFGAAGQAFPDSLSPALKALQNRWFYTVDVAYPRAGQPLIIEVGDGQVSDCKEWGVAELYDVVIARLAELATGPPVRNS